MSHNFSFKESSLKILLLFKHSKLDTCCGNNVKREVVESERREERRERREERGERRDRTMHG